MQDLAEFTNMNPWLISGLVVSGFAVIFYELRQKSRNIGSLDTATAVRVINSGGAIVDVRDTSRFSVGHIVDARNVIEQELLSSPDSLSKNKHGTLLVCDNGSNSSNCAAKLRKQGIDNVFSLRGGLAAWQAENLPIVREDNGGND